MEAKEIRVLEALERAVRTEPAEALIAEIVARVERSLEADPGASMAWEPIPLDVYESLPEGVRSSWVFILRARVVTGAERHPNSRQRMRSWRGGGDFQTRPGTEWQSHLLRSDPGAAVDEQWLSIPPNVWHQGVVGDQNWVVVSFQTASERDLIEERPDGEDEDSVRRSKYLD